MKFLHAADLHIDSPMRGLQAWAGSLAEHLQSVTRASLQNVVRLAIEEQVDFVIVAGDLFDGKWQHVETGLWTAAQFRELERAGIRVLMIRGNHDAASKVRSCLTWPGNVHDFDTRRPETVRLDELGVALHGQGFSRQEVTEDLAIRYPDPLAGMINIGLLHTSLQGSSEHETYAPTHLRVLQDKGYDYWALGHIHQRSEPPLSQQPYVAYSGNTQGRHVREQGEKGVLLVEMENGEPPTVEFRATDVLRWYQISVTLETEDDLEAMFEAADRQLRELVETADGRWQAVRLLVSGPCRAHRQLMAAEHREHAVAELRNVAAGLSDRLLVETVRLDTAPALDWDAICRSPDLLGKLIRDTERRCSDPAELEQIAGWLSPLSDRYGAELAESELDLGDPETIARWTRQAQRLLASALWETGT